VKSEFTELQVSGRQLVRGTHSDMMALYQILGMYERLMIVLSVSWLFGGGMFYSGNEKYCLMKIHRQGAS